jgi:sec-independent protein translocase protein TatB
MVREAELDEVRKQVEKTGSDITRDIEKTVDPQGEVTKALSAPELSGSPLDPSTPPSAELPPPAAPAELPAPAPAPAPETPAATPSDTTAPQKPAA